MGEGLAGGEVLDTVGVADGVPDGAAVRLGGAALWLGAGEVAGTCRAGEVAGCAGECVLCTGRDGEMCTAGWLAGWAGSCDDAGRTSR